ncbi:5-formyltetrahydrofolate cyclo-ligase [Kovacikia minuta CCNUW1]|nr:5-formyltetrahydrofolate cyclo-ligase [Kovacikia minuta]UBF29650.1 5-formyltetrahydrofolate cyclo-ligase [Kovacikia minuta CCNUW1]
MGKAELRKTLLKTRQSLPIETWREKSLQLCSHLQTASRFAEAKTILAYFSIRQEPNLDSLFALPKTWGFPRCVGKSLIWHVWSSQYSLPLQPGAYGILEPHPDAPMLEPDQVDLILVPAIACDLRGYRLGYGGGFYDRLFSSLEWENKPTVGIVFDFARLPSLPSDPWDQPLEAVCTETGFFFTSSEPE